MPNEIQRALGECPAHGEVEATRELPRVSFPPMITAVRRAMARRRPFRCPACGTAVHTS